VIPRAQSLPKHLAHILRENDLRAFASLASWGKRGALAGAVAVTRGCQETVNLASAYLRGDPRDLSARIDGESFDQKQGGTTGN
jgi:hypothetical protein